MKSSGLLDIRLYDDVFLLAHILRVMSGELTESEKEKLKNKFLKDKDRMLSEWIPVSERLPEKGGDYLISQKEAFTDYIYRSSIASYALNLYDVDEYDFVNKKHPGWYEYDSEYGYYEIDDVVAWMPLPESYKPQESEDKK